MNRRGFFAAFAAAPLVALGARAAFSAHTAVAATPPLPAYSPIKGQLRHMMNASSHGYTTHGHAVQAAELPSHSHGYASVAVPALYIWSGDAWVAYDSFEGVAVRNEMLRKAGA